MSGHSQSVREASIGQRRTWATFALALVISIVSTVLFGSILLLALDNVWWVAIAGSLSLFLGGAYIGVRTGESEPLFGAVLTALYFSIVVIVTFSGEILQILPDPLPGVAIGDSTFFFVSPLLLLAAGVTGSVVGGRMTTRKSE